jgi:hypothetical protein
MMTRISSKLRFRRDKEMEEHPETVLSEDEF